MDEPERRRPCRLFKNCTTHTVCMSLTSFLKIPAVKTLFRTEFPVSKMPAARTQNILRAPPVTRNYALVGSAFDYLLRFYLEHTNPSHLTVSGEKWIAEKSVDAYCEYPEWNASPNHTPTPAEIEYHKVTLLARLRAAIRTAKTLHAEYLQDGEITDDLLTACIMLAKLDAYYRAGILNETFDQHADRGDLTDLRSLLSLAAECTSDLTATCHCLLNPEFGSASVLVGGADADIIVDGTLIDIKTTKHLKLTQDYYNQLIGYYVLSRLAGGTVGGRKDITITHLAVYFSRHGLLHTIPITGIITDEQRFAKFTRVFVAGAREIFRA